MSEEKHKNALKENEALKKEVSILKEQLSFLFKNMSNTHLINMVLK